MTTALGIAGAGAVLALVAFFLPWVRYQQATYSGFDLALAIAPALAGVAAGGLKGFHLALHAVPVLAAVTLACLGLAARQGRSDAAARLLGWAAAAALRASRSPSHGASVVKLLRNRHLWPRCLFWIQGSSPFSPCGRDDGRITSHPVGRTAPAP